MRGMTFIDAQFVPVRLLGSPPVGAVVDEGGAFSSIFDVNDATAVNNAISGLVALGSSDSTTYANTIYTLGQGSQNSTDPALATLMADALAGEFQHAILNGGLNPEAPWGDVDFQKVAIADWGGYPNLNGTAEQSLDLSGFNLEGALLLVSFQCIAGFLDSFQGL